MKFTSTTILLLIAVASLVTDSKHGNVLVEARKSSGRPSPGRRGPPSRPSRGGRPSSRAASSRSRPQYEEEEDDEDDYDDEEFGFPEDELDGDEEEEEDFGADDFDVDDEDDFDNEEDEEEEEMMPRKRPSGRPSGSRRPPGGRPSSGGRGRPSSGASSRARPSRYADDEDDYDRRPSRSAGGRSAGGRRQGPPPSSRGGRRPTKGGRVVPYTRKQQQPSTFARGLDVIRNSMPDTAAVREAAAKSISAARESTSNLSTNLYREVKGLTSSELEQVMLKATRPDDAAVKGKHAERLISVTYQISPRFDIYDSVLRKLWSKMAEKDWRTNIKALYILHRFSADGAPGHGPALKAHLRELRRTVDPKRKQKYFNTKQLLAGDDTPQNKPYKAFMSRYAHYVLLRAQCFAGTFDEIGTMPAPATDRRKKKGSAAAAKPITSTCLKLENFEAARMLLQNGVKCQLKKGEGCENTAIAAERVAADLINLCGATATALNRALNDDDLLGADPALLKKWCELYSEELVPQTRAMVKKTSPKLDKFGLYLPSRMSVTVSPALLQKGMNLDTAPSQAAAKDDASKSDEEIAAPKDKAAAAEASDEGDNDGDEADEDGASNKRQTRTSINDDDDMEDEDEDDQEGDEYDEYEYEYDEDGYDDEDDL